MTAAREWNVWSTTARVVVTDPACLDEAVALTQDLLADVDQAASRFREDSELRRLRSPATEVSPLLADLLAVALRAAAETDGAVDPTVGATLCDLGYDRDIGELEQVEDRVLVRVRRVPGWRALRLDGLTLRLPPGVELDLGATAKARTADLAAQTIADRLATGTLVSLGGDLATAGPAPTGGWQVRVHDDPDDPDAHVALPAGGAMATSSTVRRTWRRGGAAHHHILDPISARPAEAVWRTVSVVADSCVTANTASTATLARGRVGESWLRLRRLPSRLVGDQRGVVLLGGWPAEAAA